ncbi:MAG TPA: GNAT family protein, partial [Bauldia sp.]|nr:GNAT family protein [Bauldia sp.]
MGAGGSREAGSVTYELHTARLIMRPRRATDVVALNALAANPAIAPNLCTTISAEGGASVTIIERHSGRLIGGAEHGSGGLGTRLEIAVWIGEPDWRQGYGTEAAHALIDHLFAGSDVERIWCSARAANERARAVIARCGFQFRGTGMVRVAGRGAFPVERFALDRRSWLSLKEWSA